MIDIAAIPEHTISKFLGTDIVHVAFLYSIYNRLYKTYIALIIIIVCD